ncbi:MAG: hypothetical protein KC635_22385 [Myxococcales bacterium]|nr:hypothetical protein [Myxococcales bacterium]
MLRFSFALVAAFAMAPVACQDGAPVPAPGSPTPPTDPTSPVAPTAPPTTAPGRPDLPVPQVLPREPVPLLELAVAPHAVTLSGADARYAFPTTLSGTDFVRLAAGGVALGTRPVALLAGDASLPLAPAALERARFPSGDVLSYPELAAGVTLRYRVQARSVAESYHLDRVPAGVSADHDLLLVEEIVIDSFADAAPLLDVDGELVTLPASVRTRGPIALLDGDGAVRVRIPAPVAWDDAAGQVRVPIEHGLTVDERGDGHYFLRVPGSYLAAATYPVVVDPHLDFVGGQVECSTDWVGCTEASCDACNDGNSCTADQCLGGLCVRTLRDDVVADLDVCTDPGGSAIGVCRGDGHCDTSPARDAGACGWSWNPCLVATSDPADDLCAAEPVADGLACFTVGTCQAGACDFAAAAADTPCRDALDCNYRNGDFCRTYACEPVSGADAGADVRRCALVGDAEAGDACAWGTCEPGSDPDGGALECLAPPPPCDDGWCSVFVDAAWAGGLSNECVTGVVADGACPAAWYRDTACDFEGLDGAPCASGQGVCTLTGESFAGERDLIAWSFCLEACNAANCKDPAWLSRTPYNYRKGVDPTMSPDCYASACVDWDTELPVPDGAPGVCAAPSPAPAGMACEGDGTCDSMMHCIKTCAGTTCDAGEACDDVFDPAIGTTRAVCVAACDPATATCCEGDADCAANEVCDAGGSCVPGPCADGSCGQPLTLVIEAVDQDGEALPGVTLNLDGADVALPATVAAVSGVPLAATRATFCGGDFPIDAGLLVPALDGTVTTALPAGTSASEATPGASVLRLAFENRTPHVLWNFENTGSLGAAWKDAVDGWIPQERRGVPVIDAGGVGNAISLVDVPGNQPVQAYARLTSTGGRFSNDASLRQRDFLAAESWTIELMFENGKLLQSGMSPRLTTQPSRLRLTLGSGGFATSITDASFSFNGVGRRQLDYVTEGWHHVALRYDHVTGDLTLFLDGVTFTGWTTNLGAGTVLPRGTGIYFGDRYGPADVLVDEYAGYVGALSPDLINRHARDALDLHLPYATCTPPRALVPVDDEPESTSLPAGLDARHLAPGYPDYAEASGGPDVVLPLAQLASYPLPRFRPGHTLPPLASWSGMGYIAGQGQGLSTATLNARKVAILEEMAARWHYYLKLSDNVGRSNPEAAISALANAHPEWRTFVIGLWPQLVNGSYNGFVLDADDQAYLDARGMALLSGPFIKGGLTQLSLEHFPNDGTDVLSNHNSPVALQTWAIDGKAMAFKLGKFTSQLGPRVAAGANAIDLYNENDEVVSTRNMPASSVAGDPVLLQMFEDYAGAGAIDASTDPPTLDGPSLTLFLGYAHTLVRGAYMEQIGLALPGAVLTVYAVDGFNQYRPAYEEARFIQTPVDGMHRPTPDLYPRQPSWWYTGAGAWHGFTWPGQARKKEIEQGDKLFWPFLAAGWANDPRSTMLPGQWLGLCKTWGVMGADSAFPAFFSLQSPFPEPEGWVWQMAIPAYAQAITSRYEDVLRQGDLVLARGGWAAQAGVYKDYYSLYSPNPQDLFVARRLGDRWVIAGSVQTTLSRAGWRPLWKIGRVYVDLDGDGEKDEIRLPIRRQGSVYVLDRSVTPATLVQLDRWHEPWHPSYWRSSFDFDAEVDDGRSAGAGAAWVPATERPAGAGAYDFSDFTSYLRVAPAAGAVWSPTPTAAEAPLADAPAARYVVRPREQVDLYVWVRARVADGGVGRVYVRVSEGTAAEQGAEIEVAGDAWAWYRVDAGSGAPARFDGLAPCTHEVPAGGGAHYDVEHVVTVRPGYDGLEIDQLVLTPDAADDPALRAPESALSEVADR